MPLKSLPIPPIPEETARVAQAIFPRGNVVMQVRDALEGKGVGTRLITSPVLEGEGEQAAHLVHEIDLPTLFPFVTNEEPSKLGTDMGIG